MLPTSIIQKIDAAAYYFSIPKSEFMHFKKPFIVIAAIASVVAISVAATPAQQQEAPKLVNLKVFPKNISFRVLDHEMDVWSESLGVRCNFCHERNTQTGKMDFASDAKPEKEAARHMFTMTAKINKKFFGAKKDSLGMVMASGVNCNTCHRGSAHPEVKVPEREKGPGGPPAGDPASAGKPKPASGK
jgi:hypothetical protein